MLFDMGYQAGRNIAEAFGLDAYLQQATQALVHDQLLSQQIQDSSVLINPVTNMAYGGNPLLRGGRNVTPPIGGESVIFSYQCPNGYRAVINALALVYLGGTLISGNGDLYFRVEVDGVPYRTLSQVTIQIGSVNQNEPINSLTLSSNETLTVIAVHVANAALASDCLARISGYEYPVDNKW